MRALIYPMVVLSLVVCLSGLPMVSALATETAGPAEEDRSGGAMAVDVLLLRPLGLVATVAGAVLYVLSLPFSAAGGNTEEARQKLVEEPACYTFQRPLGEL
ncbi:MAG: hypothetical protein V2L15_09625 [Desulfobacteraceae bacterium]|nr:hypothetical protein [Desulfobacteraceae bacterium]